MRHEGSRRFEKINTEGVRQFQPRVELWQPWEQSYPIIEDATLKGLRRRSRIANASQPLQGCA
jgi:hypothetical protein